jgi:hypothetical protein
MQCAANLYDSPAFRRPSWICSTCAGSLYGRERVIPWHAGCPQLVNARGLGALRQQPKDELADIKTANAERDWDNAISSCGPIVPPCPPANDAFPVRRARIVAARLDTYRPSVKPLLAAMRA